MKCVKVKNGGEGFSWMNALAPACLWGKDFVKEGIISISLQKPNYLSSNLFRTVEVAWKIFHTLIQLGFNGFFLWLWYFATSIGFDCIGNVTWLCRIICLISLYRDFYKLYLFEKSCLQRKVWSDFISIFLSTLLIPYCKVKYRIII